MSRSTKQVEMSAALLDHLALTAVDLRCGMGVQNVVWLHLDDGRVLALQLWHDMASLATLTVPLVDDVRGEVVSIPAAPPRLGVVAFLAYGATPDPSRVLAEVHPRRQQAMAFAAALDAEVMAQLDDLSQRSGRHWTSTRNYNRLIVLPAHLRERRLQALRRFGALVAPVLLTAHDYPRVGTRDAWREHDDEVLAAIDEGRNLVGVLAAHYQIGRALVRAPVCQHPWPEGSLKMPTLLAVLDATPAMARPGSAADWAEVAGPLSALASVAGDNTLALHALSAAVFRRGWQPTWDALLRRHDSPHLPLTVRLMNLRDYLAAALRALQEAGQLDVPQEDAPEVTDTPPASARLALAWVQARGLGSLLRASERWHEWVQQRRGRLSGEGPWPALLGVWAVGPAQATECLDAAALECEGEAMRHCVGSYDLHCAHHGHRIVHVELPGERATLELAPRSGDSAIRYNLAQLLGPDNDEVSDAMHAWGLWVLRRVNRAANLARRQEVLHAAMLLRQERSRVGLTAAPQIARLDAESQATWVGLTRQGLPRIVARWQAGQVVLDAELAGVAHHDAEDHLDILTEGQLLTLVREPDNPHDAQAVRVQSLCGVLGYLPRPRNLRVACALDAGVALQTRLTGLSTRSERGLRLWVRIKCVPESTTPPPWVAGR